jgi:hypothetical protein
VSQSLGSLCQCVKGPEYKILCFVVKRLQIVTKTGTFLMAEYVIYFVGRLYALELGLLSDVRKSVDINPVM